MRAPEMTSSLEEQGLWGLRKGMVDMCLEVRAENWCCVGDRN